MAEPVAPVTVLFIGDIGCDEFRPTVRWLRSRSHLTSARGVTESWHLLAGGLDPLLVVLAQSYPGQYSSETVERLRLQKPLAGLVQLIGAWSDGETCSGRPVAGVTRVHWHRWRPWFEAEWERWRQHRCPVWGLAPAASDEELFAWQVRQFAGYKNTFVDIVSACDETARALADMVSAAGFTSHVAALSELTVRNSRSLVVWDDAIAARREPVPLRQVVHRVAPTPVIALLSFARLTDLEDAAESGAAEVLSKPFALADLAWLLCQHIPNISRTVPIRAAGTPAA